MAVNTRGRKRQKHCKRLDLGNVATLVNQLRGIVDEFRYVKHEHKPRFDEMFSRKLFCLLYLYGVESEQGYFSGRDVHYFFLNNLNWAKSYFERLVSEGWITKIEMAKARTPYTGMLSPLSLEFISLLRRRLEMVADEIDPNLPVVPGKQSKHYKQWLIDHPNGNRPDPKPDADEPIPATEPNNAKASAPIEPNIDSDDIFTDLSDTR